MKATREFNIKREYPFISEENAQAIQRYYNIISAEISSDETFKRYAGSFKMFCNLINEPDVIPLREWDPDIINQYLSDYSATYSTTLSLFKVLKGVLKEAGYKGDLEKINAIEWFSQYRSNIFTFEDMNNMIRRAFNETHPNSVFEYMSDWSTSIVMCYLLWLGYTKREIVEIQKSDYHDGTFTYRGKYRKSNIHISSGFMEAYIREYQKSAGYYFYDEYHQNRFIHYNETDSFLKTVSSENGLTFGIVENYGRKISKYFGFNPDEILLAGRLNKLAIWEMTTGKSVSIKNGRAIAELLGINASARMLKSSEAGMIITIYDSYLKQRNEHLMLNSTYN